LAPGLFAQGFKSWLRDDGTVEADAAGAIVAETILRFRLLLLDLAKEK
jgi:hypothetical protein